MVYAPQASWNGVSGLAPPAAAEGAAPVPGAPRPEDVRPLGGGVLPIFGWGLEVVRPLVPLPLPFSDAGCFANEGLAFSAGGGSAALVGSGPAAAGPASFGPAFGVAPGVVGLAASGPAVAVPGGGTGGLGFQVAPPAVALADAASAAEVLGFGRSTGGGSTMTRPSRIFGGGWPAR